MAAPPTFGELLHRHRLAARLTQEQLAERAGMSVRGLSDLERGERRVPQQATLRQLVTALGLAGPSAVAFAEAAARQGQVRPVTATVITAARSSLPPLPRPLTGFIGREQEAAAIVERLTIGQMRLLTLYGPGGVGKTRLALHVAATLADHFADGVAFASLASVSRSGQAAASVVQALGLHPGPERSAEQTLYDGLRSREVLLVLDNLEQVPDAAELAVSLLEHAPRLVILATSRSPLRAYGEWEVPVPPLLFPGAQDATSLDALEGCEAIQLFVQRGQAVRPGFALDAGNAQAILAICRRLDGLPLALELAAARLRVLSPRELLVRLERRLPLLVVGPVPCPSGSRRCGRRSPGAMHCCSLRSKPSSAGWPSLRTAARLLQRRRS